MRDCENCKNHTDKGCTKWKCEFWPTTKNDLGVDAVSRKDVLDAIDVKAWEFCDYLISKGRNDEQKPVSHFADNLRECVREELPSVTPQEPKTGHWEYGYAFPDGNYCKCSECKEIIKCIYPMHYCPNCGAKMVEPQEGEGCTK